MPVRSQPFTAPLACVVAAAALLLGVGAAPAHAEAGGRIGVASHLIWLGESDAEAEMRRIRAGGVEWIREDFRWDLLQPAPGRFDWSRSDALMAAASKSGVNVLAILGYSARWASSDPSGEGDVHYPPRDPADYARFARAVVERYGTAGSFWSERPDLAPRPLGAVELWNEPWGWWFWKPAPDPRAYARLALAGAAAVKVAQPDVKTLLSGDLLLIRRDGSAGKWLGPVLDAEPALGRLIDAYATHPYPSPRDRSPLDTSSAPLYRFDRAHLTRAVASAHGAPRPIWITEVGWSTAAGVPDAVSEETQARYLRLAATNALGKQGVERMFVFGWDRSNGVNGDREGNYGLQRSDGSMKPAWSALTRLGPLGGRRASAARRLAITRAGRKRARAARACTRKWRVRRQRARRLPSRAARRRAMVRANHKRGRCRKAITPR
jgi:polysaccharide biosynthesis protein PslG